MSEQTRIAQLEKEVKEHNDKDLSCSTHAFTLRAELQGRIEERKATAEDVLDLLLGGEFGDIDYKLLVKEIKRIGGVK